MASRVSTRHCTQLKWRSWRNTPDAILATTQKFCGCLLAAASAKGVTDNIICPFILTLWVLSLITPSQIGHDPYQNGNTDVDRERPLLNPMSVVLFTFRAGANFFTSLPPFRKRKKWEERGGENSGKKGRKWEREQGISSHKHIFGSKINHLLTHYTT